MDIYNLFPSEDVSEYCRKINHQFSPIEIAALIQQLIHVKLIPVEEQNKYYKELIDCYPDMQFHRSVHFHVKSSLHAHLRSLIERNERAVDFFFHPNKKKNDKYFYSLCSYDVEKLGLKQNIDSIGEDIKKYEDYKRFETVEELFADVLPHWTDDKKRDYIRVFINKPDQKNYFHFYTDITRSGVVIDTYDKLNLNGRKHPGNLWSLFVKVPSPFTPGDIVKVYNDEDSCPLIIKSIPPFICGEEELSGVSHEYYCYLTNRPDYATFYYINRYGILAASEGAYSSWGRSLLELEYYKGDISDVDERLVKISQSIKTSNVQKLNVGLDFTDLVKRF